MAQQKQKAKVPSQTGDGASREKLATSETLLHLAEKIRATKIS